MDRLIAEFDRALRAVAGVAHAERSSPAEAVPDAALEEKPKAHAAALMRVNHVGEICAQALYQGQALTAREPQARQALEKAAREEEDHLAWSADRIRELGGRPSLLNPLWYAGSFAIGALAATFGDRVSLGFVAETERQVEGHLDSHLARLPVKDLRSRAIVEAMRTDEISHGAAARAAGGAELPAVARTLMKHTSRVMTHTAYWI